MDYRQWEETCAISIRSPGAFWRYSSMVSAILGEQLNFPFHGQFHIYTITAIILFTSRQSMDCTAVNCDPRVIAKIDYEAFKRYYIASQISTTRIV